MAGTYDRYIKYNELAYKTFRYADTTFRMILNEQTGGTLTSSLRPTKGNYYSDVVWGNQANKAELAAPNVQSAVTAEQQRQLQRIDIKVGCRMPQYAWQSIASDWIGISRDEQAAIWGRTVAESFIRIKIESIVGALVAGFSKGIIGTGAPGAIGAKDTEIEKVIDDQSGSAVGLDKRLDVSKLLVAQGKFGDMAGAITGIIMHGSAFFGMQAENLRSFQNLFMYQGSFVATSSTGLRIFVTDVPALTFKEGSVTKYRTLLLRPNSANIFENGDFDQNISRDNGKTWIETTAQAQQTFNVGIRGLTWSNIASIHPVMGTTDVTGTGTAKLAGLHMNAGVLDNPASWERVGTDETQPITFKELPGAMIISQ